MAPSDLRDKSQLWATWLRDVLVVGSAIAGVSLFMVTVIMAGLMSLYGQALRSAAQEWLGITAIYKRITELAGEDRVITQPYGMSYVRTPVVQGESIELVLVVGRTQKGTDCILREIIPLFTDDTGNSIAGRPREPASQLSPEITRRELVIDYPSRLRPGRASLQLQLEYDCDGKTVFDMTYPTPFDVLPRPHSEIVP
jgi:hypothetical protein